MSQYPKEWCIAAMASRKPMIEVDPLRPVALRTYQKAVFDWLQDSTSTKQVTVMRSNVGIDPHSTLRAREIMNVLPMLPVMEFRGVFGKGVGA